MKALAGGLSFIVSQGLDMVNIGDDDSVNKKAKKKINMDDVMCDNFDEEEALFK